MLCIFNRIKTRQIEIRSTELVVENKNCDLLEIQLTKGVFRVIAPTLLYKDDAFSFSLAGWFFFWCPFWYQLFSGDMVDQSF